MNDEILLTFISGDGNEKDGATTVCTNKISHLDEMPIFKIDDAADLKQLNDAIMKTIAIKEQSKRHFPLTLHIDAIKEIIKRTRKNILPQSFINKFNSNNEEGLFILLSEIGNIIIQNSDYTSIVYLPKNVTDEQIQSLNNLKGFFMDKFFIVKQVIDKNSHKVSVIEYNGIDNFFSKFEKNIK